MITFGREAPVLDSHGSLECHVSQRMIAFGRAAAVLDCYASRLGWLKKWDTLPHIASLTWTNRILKKPSQTLALQGFVMVFYILL